VTQLTSEQIQAIFTGRIQRWSELGGADRPIVLVSREAGSGTFSAFEELVMEGVTITPATLRQGSNGAVRQIIADHPDAIGYVSLGIVDASVRAVAIDGVEPAVATVESGAYTLVRPFLLVWRRGHQLSPLAIAFLEYTRSDEARAQLAHEGLVPGGASP
jgi:phosphate transport system substrate-binding protein